MEMATTPPKVIVVDDEINILKTIGICFDSVGFDTKLFSKPLEAQAVLREEKFDLAFFDLKMSPIDGMELLNEVRTLAPETTVIIITAHGSIDSAIEAVKRGAYHYLQKPFDFKELQLLALRAWEHHELKSEVRGLRQRLAETKDRAWGGFLTRNREMQNVLELAATVAESDLSVLIEGESGTGKELVAQFVHQESGRSAKPFVKVNCAAIPENLLESELFGHIKGAFTGALKDRQGRFELAHTGTIFLDEIGELPPMIQAKLLRVLHNKEYERVGESHTRQVDARVLSATNKNLDEALKEGTFREDLFYRLNGVRLKLLPLRDRPEDIPLLLEHFIKKFSKDTPFEISPEALKILRAYRWSGNVRELENVMQRALLVARNGVIERMHLPEEFLAATQRADHTLTLEELEKLHITRVLQQALDYQQAAEILGIDPATLWRKRKKYGL